MVAILGRSPSWESLTASAIIALAVAIWFKLVQDNVPSPYLDEVFHVRQAHEYILGNWRTWDPKITTPPGLYLVSYLQPRLFIFSEQSSTQNLRATNAVGSILLVVIVGRLLRLITSKDEPEKLNGGSSGSLQLSSAELVHSIVNICLFPPLFFFYGLYYTDVLSALSVLYAYQCYLQDKGGLRIIVAGLVSLLFRQTNIFWVSMFLGGLAFCRAVPKGRPDVEFASEPGFQAVVEGSWQHASAYDPLVSEAGFEGYVLLEQDPNISSLPIDYIKCSISFAIVGILNLQTALRSILPHLLILASFLAFLIWNGGVVLGDKENHTISIHLAQMLYIWPYITFFSVPLLYPHLLNILLPQSILPPFLRSSRIAQQNPRLTTTLPTMAIMLLIAHYNTLIHPFTLADNRHYTFYVFRILTRHPLIKYLAVPIYYLCATAAITALGSPQSTPPIQTMSARKLSKQPEYSSPTPRTDRSPNTGPRASFLLLWLLATSASVITTPLVEPRYFIVPWLIWRLHIANTTSSSSQVSAGEKSSTAKKAQSNQHDHRLYLETAWFLLINAGVGYMFLYRGFEWVQEPGRVQRFMW